MTAPSATPWWTSPPPTSSACWCTQAAQCGESASISKNNINIAAYQDGYTGIGGFGYCHYLFVTDSSPCPGPPAPSSLTCPAPPTASPPGARTSAATPPIPLWRQENEVFHHKTGGMAEDGTTVEFAALNDAL